MSVSAFSDTNYEYKITNYFKQGSRYLVYFKSDRTKPAVLNFLGNGKFTYQENGMTEDSKCVGKYEFIDLTASRSHIQYEEQDPYRFSNEKSRDYLFRGIMDCSADHGPNNITLNIKFKDLWLSYLINAGQGNDVEITSNLINNNTTKVKIFLREYL